MRRARSALFNELVIYWIIFSSSTVTDSTFKYAPDDMHTKCMIWSSNVDVTF